MAQFDTYMCGEEDPNDNGPFGILWLVAILIAMLCSEARGQDEAKQAKLTSIGQSCNRMSLWSKGSGKPKIGSKDFALIWTAPHLLTGMQIGFGYQRFPIPGPHKCEFGATFDNWWGWAAGRKIASNPDVYLGYTIPWPIPNMPSLAGTKFYVQAYSITNYKYLPDPRYNRGFYKDIAGIFAKNGWLGLSNTLEVRIGW